MPNIAETNPQLAKDLSYICVSRGFAKPIALHNYAKLVFNQTLLNKQDVEDYRLHSKLDNMRMRVDTRVHSDTLVKRNGKLHTDGTPRPGMMKAAKREFQLDTKYIRHFRRPIIQNMIKSITKGIELGHINKKYFADASQYRVIAEYCVDNYMDKDATYNSEYNMQDQRGRAIKAILKRAGNYISNKDFRAMLRVPADQRYILKPDDTISLTAIYLFIAELTGHKCLGGTEIDKAKAGKLAYENKELPQLNLKSEEGRKDLHEWIWLHRIYKTLDKLNKRDWVIWDILIECDHTMSLAQIAGALLNDERVLEATNVIGPTLNDAWFINSVRRPVAKAYGTPTLYGSSQSVWKLVQSKGLLHEQQLPKSATSNQIEEAKAKDAAELSQLKTAFSEGRFSVLKQFKDLLIKNYTKHEPIISIDTGISQFTVHVNKWKTVSSKYIISETWNGSKFIKSFTHKPIKVPDYKAMKTFWATCLIHHLDSDLMEYNLDVNSDLYALDIHDAILCLPKDAEKFRTTAAKRLKHYNNNRTTILAKYKQSIGATSVKADIAHMELLKSVHDADDQQFLTTLMK